MRRAGKRCTCFNPRRPRGRRLPPLEIPGAFWMVSIPAVHADGDYFEASTLKYFGVSIPAVHADGDPRSRTGARWPMFQSPPSTRTATGKRPCQRATVHRFNPRRPRGRRLILFSYSVMVIWVSIPAVHADGDRPTRRAGKRYTCFNPRRPRGRRHPRAGQVNGVHVSIPAVHADGDESDLVNAQRCVVSIPAVHADGDNPTVCPCGFRAWFQSPPSTRTATPKDARLEGPITSFNPRRPRGRRRS